MVYDRHKHQASGRQQRNLSSRPKHQRQQAAAEAGRTPVQQQTVVGIAVGVRRRAVADILV